jgi:hypothetical protein
MALMAKTDCCREGGEIYIVLLEERLSSFDSRIQHEAVDRSPDALLEEFPKRVWRVSCNRSQFENR